MLNIIKKKSFITSLIIFYLLLFFSPNKIIYFSAYLIAVLLFYLQSKNLRISLFYTLILTLFSEIGLAFSWFQLEPQDLNLGSGWYISPMTIILVPLLILSLRQKIRILMPDILIFLFYFWCLIVFIVFPYQNSLFSIFSLTELVLVYFILRIHLNKNIIKAVITILVSMLTVQSLLGIAQYILRRPLGIVGESVLSSNQFGFTTVEDENIFRSVGTFFHPNLYAAFLISILPFSLFKDNKNKSLFILNILVLFAILFTFSRVAWAITIIYLLILLVKKGILNINRLNKFLFLFIIIIFISIPLITSRLASIPQAFEEFGSMGTRIKTYQEAFGIYSIYPLTGVGLDRSLEYYASNPITDLFQNTAVGSFYRIHNTFLELLSETGVIGLLLFSFFLTTINISLFIKNHTDTYKKIAIIGLTGFTLIALLNPFFHSSQFRYFFLLSAIILI